MFEVLLWARHYVMWNTVMNRNRDNSCSPEAFGQMEVHVLIWSSQTISINRNWWFFSEENLPSAECFLVVWHICLLIKDVSQHLQTLPLGKSYSGYRARHAWRNFVMTQEDKSKHYLFSLIQSNIHAECKINRHIGNQVYTYVLIDELYNSEASIPGSEDTFQ